MGGYIYVCVGMSVVSDCMDRGNGTWVVTMFI